MYYFIIIGTDHNFALFSKEKKKDCVCFKTEHKRNQSSSTSNQQSSHLQLKLGSNKVYFQKVY